MAAESGPGLKMVAPIENGDFNISIAMWIHQRVGIHRFRWENPWIFFKKSTPFFSTDVRHYPGGDFLQTPGTPRLVEIWCFFFVFPTDMRDSARRFLCVFFRVEGGRYRLYILWKYMTWIYTFHSEALSRKWAELWWNRWSLMSTSLSPKKGCACFRTSTRVGPQQSTSVSLFFNAIYLEPLSA